MVHLSHTLAVDSVVFEETTKLSGERYSSNGSSLEAGDNVTLKVIEARRNKEGGEDVSDGGGTEFPVRSLDIKAGMRKRWGREGVECQLSKDAEVVADYGGMDLPPCSSS